MFAYTFAAPATTTAATAQTGANFACIFNIINEDDLVPRLPMSDWGFVRYGTDIPGSIEDNYSSQWDALVSGDDNYTSRKTSVISTVNTLANIAEDRDECYVYRTGIDAYYVDSLYATYESAQMAVNAIIDEYPPNVAGTFYWVPTGSAQYYGYAMYQQPAFLMQLIAANMGGAIDDVDFAATRVATYLGSAKEKLISLAGLNINFDNRINHPHHVESYYLLATKLEAE